VNDLVEEPFKSDEEEADELDYPVPLPPPDYPIQFEPRICNHLPF
jgi:hypothetical protein